MTYFLRPPMHDEPRPYIPPPTPWWLVALHVVFVVSLIVAAVSFLAAWLA